MKILYSFLICFIIGGVHYTQINAQDTPPFNYLDYSCEWYNYYLGSLQYRSYGYELLYIDGDTLINNQFYLKRYYTRKDSIVPLNFFNEETVVQTSMGYYDAIRESGSGQFYIIRQNSNTESLLVNFELEFGDNLPDFYSDCIVQHIDTVFLGNRPLQQFYTYDESSYGKIVEGVGQIGALCSIFIESSSKICAFRKQEDTLYFCDKSILSQFVSPNRVHTITTIPSISQTPTSFKVYPNPVQQQLTLHSPINNWATGKIFNTLGQVVYEFKTMALNPKLEVGWLKTGMYLIQLNDDSNQQYTTKFIKK